MSIKVEKITKIYGIQKALDEVSFEIGEGEIVGFLGPNGAGKSTMMKILTGYISQTSGNAWVCSHNVLTETMSVRKKIGYLPENNPLYYDMYVKEYLTFIAGIYKVKDKQKKVIELLELTKLTEESHKKIGQLSKGYKQRVGLAQALLHNPKVLILDEPTSGLDPNQILEIRNVIKSLGTTKTILLSTHIMQEVEAVCNRIIIINKGKIVADDNKENIRQLATGRSIVIVEFSSEVKKEELLKIKGVLSVDKVEGNTWKIFSEYALDIRKDVFDFAVSKNIAVLSISKEKLSLEDVFQQLTH